MLQREDLLPIRMAEALVESEIDLGDTDSVVRVLIEYGFDVREIIAHRDGATDIARGFERARVSTVVIREGASYALA